ncbi:MAG: cupredoxin domain-containing protein [Nanoarchaeota archaeon]
MKKSVVAILAIALVLIASCANSNTDSRNKNNQDDGPPPVPTGDTKIFNIEVTSFKYTPSIINVNEGTIVILRIKNVDTKIHGFGLSGYNINKEIAAGETIEVQFVADQKGTFNFICTVPCGPGHKDVKGKVIVS